MKGVLSHAAAAGRNNALVAVLDVRRAYFYAEPLPKTFIELPDYYDLDTWTRCCGRLRRCLCGTRQASRSWQHEIERGIKAARMVIGKDVEVFLQVSLREGGGRSCTATTSYCRDQDHLLMQYGSLYESATRHENRRWERDPMMRDEIVMLNRRVQ